MAAEKVALVTGASSGIGEASALRLRDLGYRVYGAARRVERMSGLADAGVGVLKLDLTDDDSTDAAMRRLIDETGRVDVLVNNAGYGSFGALEDVPMSEARAQFEVNVFGLARVTQLALPHMRAQRGGRIINISSMGGKIYEPLGGWYHATKFAVEGLSDSLRVELKPFGIDVVIIEPGAIKTEWMDISAQNLLDVSGETPYGPQAKAMAKTFASTAANPRMSSPASVVADTVARAATARRPKTRYVVGRGARPILLARRLLPDRGFDALVRASLKTPRHA